MKFSEFLVGRSLRKFAMTPAAVCTARSDIETSSESQKIGADITKYMMIQRNRFTLVSLLLQSGR